MNIRNVIFSALLSIMILAAAAWANGYITGFGALVIGLTCFIIISGLSPTRRNQ